MKNKLKKIREYAKKHEFSKKSFAIAAVSIGMVGVYSIFRYYSLCELAIMRDASITPSADVPVICISAILALFLQYCLYQFGLKNSRNKYKVDKNGVPFADTIRGIYEQIAGKNSVNEKNSNEEENSEG